MKGRRQLRRFVSHLVVSSVLVLSLFAGFAQPAQAAAKPEFPFPVIGPSSYSNDFEAPRSNGVHHAIDIIAGKHQRIVSRTDGMITYVGYPQPNWGYAVYIRADNGYSYRYLHINNDRPGSDDGKGDGYYAYAPDIQVGKRVVKGQLIGYVGDSGNAEETVAHLHFEVYDGDRAINPYGGLRNNSYQLKSPVANYPKADNEQLPFDTFKGGASIAYGDVDGDSVLEIIAAAGPGGRYVKAFEQDGQQIARFMPNGPDFTGGVDVASGDLDGDGTDEIITGAGNGGRYVKVFNKNGELLSSFMPNGDKFLNGVDVAAGDVDGDNVDEIVTGAGPGGRYVKVFELNGQQIAGFLPEMEGSKGGMTVATGDVSGGAEDEILVGLRKGARPRVGVYSLAGTALNSFYAYSDSFTGGVRVAATDIRNGVGKDEIVTISESTGSPRARLFNSDGSGIEYSNYFGEEWWQGHYDIAAADGLVLSSMGVNRRTSLRLVEGLAY